MEELKKKFTFLERLTLGVFTCCILALTLLVLGTKVEIYQQQVKVQRLKEETEEIRRENFILQKKIDLKLDEIETVAKKYGLQRSYDRVRNIR